MKVIISSLLVATTLIVDPMSMRSGVNSSHFKSKIFNGNLAQEGEQNYMASLQLNGSHICSSGFYKKGFLITSALCAWHIGVGIQKEMKRATAVLGDVNLKNGQRVNILKIAYYTQWHVDKSNPPTNEYDSGVVMLADTIDYTHVQILNFLDFKFNLLLHKSDATVCGWGTVRNADHEDYRLENAGYSENLHCMFLNLRNSTVCRTAIPGGDYRNKLICGEAKLTGQITTLRDIGSPLTKYIKMNGKPKHYIIGITLTRYICKDGAYTRFLRSHAVVEDIQMMVENLQSEEETSESSVESSLEDLKDESSKRLK